MFFLDIYKQNSWRRSLRGVIQICFHPQQRIFVFGFLVPGAIPLDSPCDSINFAPENGSRADFVEKWTSLSEQMCFKYSACAQNLASRSSSPDSADSAAIPGNGPRRAVPDLGSTRAGGKDDGSLHKLPQITRYYPKLSKRASKHMCYF